MRSTVQIQVAPLGRVIDELRRVMPALSQDEILRHEIERVLEAAFRATKQARRQKIVATVQNDIRRNKGWRTIDGKPYRAEWRLPDPVWRSYIKKKREDQKERIARIALSRQTWLMIAKDLGLKINPPGMATAARAKVDGRAIQHRRSTARTVVGTDKLSYMIEYANPTGRYANVNSALSRAIKGRIKFMERNIKHGVFKSAESVAKKYPGLTVREAV